MSSQKLRHTPFQDGRTQVIKMSGGLMNPRLPNAVTRAQWPVHSVQKSLSAGAAGMWSVLHLTVNLVLSGSSFSLCCCLF